ncbi:MAG: hypothetical protein IJE76_10690 [Bacteroidales bacterium]|nr:hypothetical protein [Bacteroidales bacterium]
MKSKILLVLMIFIVVFYSCTKKSACADVGSDYDYHTGYFTYFDDKITINGINGKTTKVNAVFVDDECYPSCTTGVSKKTIPLNFRNNGEEIHVAISASFQTPNGIHHPLEIFIYDLECIEKID